MFPFLSSFCSLFFFHASFFALCSFFVPSCLSFFLPTPLCLLFYLDYSEKYSALLQPSLKDTLRERCHPISLTLPLIHSSNPSMDGPSHCLQHAGGHPASSVPSLSYRNYQVCTIPGLRKVEFLFRHTVFQLFLSLKLLVNSSTTPAITLKYILKHCKLSNSL